MYGMLPISVSVLTDGTQTSLHSTTAVKIQILSFQFLIIDSSLPKKKNSYSNGFHWSILASLFAPQLIPHNKLQFARDVIHSFALKHDCVVAYFV